MTKEVQAGTYLATCPDCHDTVAAECDGEVVECDCGTEIRVVI